MAALLAGAAGGFAGLNLRRGRGLNPRHLNGFLFG
jgi:hypothetical protein